MAKLVWDQVGERLFETGVKEVALFVMGDDKKYKAGVAWNGITAINETPSGAEATELYADDTKYLTLRSAETLGGTIEAYMSPAEFDACDGSAELATGVTIGQQSRKSFALAYKTSIGSDTDGNDKGYKLHIIYGCTASPSERAYSTINDSPEAMTLSWEFTTTPVTVSNAKPTSIVTINSIYADADKLKALEEKLYGGSSTEATLVTPDEIKAMMTAS